jgi:hypothetical protein
MTTTDTITDIGKLEAAEHALERALNELHRIAAAPEFNADEDDDDDADPSVALRLEWAVEDLNDVLDCPSDIASVAMAAAASRSPRSTARRNAVRRLANSTVNQS